MSYISKEDGQIHASAGEQYHYHGWVTVRTRVDFDSPYEEGDLGFAVDLVEALNVALDDDWEVGDTDELECEIVEIEDD